MNTEEQEQESWQVEANGEVFDTNFAEMTMWIDEGSLLRIDRVRKKNLRWIEAGKVPSLLAVFNAKDSGEPFTPPVVTTTQLSPTTLPGDRTDSVEPPVEMAPAVSGEAMCSIHADVPAVYTCEICSNSFCKACPSSYGGTVKICPFCGAMCKSIAEVEKARAETASHSADMSDGFGVRDFASSLVYPFRFKVSLVLGAIMFMFFSIGQSAVGFGGVLMIGGAVFSFMLANTLTFGILANTVENFAQGKVGLDFMPSFDDFSIWDDVVHPFFLSIGVYISSFGPVMAVVLIAFFMVMGEAKSEVNAMKADAARTVNPQLPYAANAAAQSEKVREILQQNADRQKQRVAEFQEQQERIMAAVDSGEELHEQRVPHPNEFNEEKIEEIQKMIVDSRKAQLESVVGKAPETVAQEKEALVSKILGYGVIFILLGGICLLWGFFYFPAACAVAGYTRSFVATLNPTVGLDTIRRLGFNYVKILLMGLALLIVFGFLSGVLSLIFLPFEMPGVGNIPANAIGALFTFYFSVVFSCVIGFAMYKASDRLSLFR